MDYIKSYNKVVDAHTLQTDFINFIDNKLIELKISNLELEKEGEKIRTLLDGLKQAQTEYLRKLHLFEMQQKLRGGLK